MRRPVRSMHKRYRFFRWWPYRMTVSPPHVYHWLWWMWS